MALKFLKVVFPGGSGTGVVFTNKSEAFVLVGGSLVALGILVS